MDDSWDDGTVPRVSGVDSALGRRFLTRRVVCDDGVDDDFFSSGLVDEGTGSKRAVSSLFGVP